MIDMHIVLLKAFQWHQKCIKKPNGFGGLQCDDIQMNTYFNN
jgi:hypothetical protein